MENDKQSGKKFRILDTPWGVFGLIILLFGLIFLIGHIEHIKSLKECNVPGCSNTCKKGEKYCKEHRHYDLYQQEKLNTISRKVRNKQKSEKSKSNTIPSDNSGDIYGAERYSSPDDFADEWEDDFDSWEDAYDYWEDVME